MVSKVIFASFVAFGVALSSGSLAQNATAKPGGEKPAAKSKTPEKLPWQQAMDAGRYQDAANHLTAVIADVTESPDARAKAYLNRALAYQYLRQYKHAIADYRAALQLDALDLRVRAIALYNRGLANRKVRRPAAAIEDFTSALHLDGKLAHAYYSRANVMRSIGRYEFALEDYRRALQNGYPTPHLPNYGIAVTHEALKQPAKARAALKITLTTKPDFKPALRRYAELAGEPYHAPPPARKVAGFKGKNPTGSKISIEPHNPPGHNKLPAPVRPPSAYLTAQKGGGVTATDTLTTASLGGRAVHGKAMPGSDKLAYRYPGFSGATKPVPHRVAKSAEKPGASHARLPQIIPAAGTSNRAVALAGKPHKTPDGGEQKIREKLLTAQNAQAKKTVKVASLSPNLPVSAKNGSDSGNVTGWLVQINSQRTEAAAKSTWKKLKRRHARALKDADVVFQRADLGKKGIYWRVRLAGFDTKSDALKHCTRLKRNGVRCFAVRAK